jgi:hypothetical protein
MNPPPPGTPVGGGFPNIPIWYPPMSAKWIVTALVIFAAAVSNRFKPSFRSLFASPIGFFLTSVLAFLTFKFGFPPLAFAILFFLLNMWAAHTSEGYADVVKDRMECDKSAASAYPQFFEGFLGASDIDFVTNEKRWFVERMLKEHPEAIVDKSVQTTAISGFSAQGNTGVGNT